MTRWRTILNAWTVSVEEALKAKRSLTYKVRKQTEEALRRQKSFDAMVMKQTEEAQQAKAANVAREAPSACLPLSLGRCDYY